MIDFEFLVGGGVETTLSYLWSNGLDAAAAYIEGGTFDSLENWLKWRINYYYPAPK